MGGRECIFPEVPRTRHAGHSAGSGLTTSASAQHQWFDHIRLYEPGRVGPSRTGGGGLTAEGWDAATEEGQEAWMREMLAQGEVSRCLPDMVRPGPGGEPRVILFPFQAENETAATDEGWDRLATALGLLGRGGGLDRLPRGFHRGTVRTRLGGNLVILISSDSPYAAAAAADSDDSDSRAAAEDDGADAEKVAESGARGTAGRRAQSGAWGAAGRRGGGAGRQRRRRGLPAPPYPQAPEDRQALTDGPCRPDPRQAFTALRERLEVFPGPAAPGGDGGDDGGGTEEAAASCEELCASRGRECDEGGLWAAWADPECVGLSAALAIHALSQAAAARGSGGGGGGGGGRGRRVVRGAAAAAEEAGPSEEEQQAAMVAACGGVCELDVGEARAPGVDSQTGSCFVPSPVSMSCRGTDAFATTRLCPCV